MSISLDRQTEAGCMRGSYGVVQPFSAEFLVSRFGPAVIKALQAGTQKDLGSIPSSFSSYCYLN